jgi:hypothetical protein
MVYWQGNAIGSKDHWPVLKILTEERKKNTHIIIILIITTTTTTITIIAIITLTLGISPPRQM